jgi:hypothetical protein
MATSASAPVSGRNLTLARWLFGSAAIYNVSGGGALLFLRPSLQPLLGLDPVAGTNIPTLYIACGFIILFGYAYFLLARDPVRYRPYIPLAVIGKAMVIVSLLVPWLAGQISWPLLAIGGGDPVYLVLFLLFLRRVPAD